MIHEFWTIVTFLDIQCTRNSQGIPSQTIQYRTKFKACYPRANFQTLKKTQFGIHQRYTFSFLL